MNVTEIDVTEDDLYSITGQWVSTLLADTEVIVGQMNRVPMPKKQSFVIMTSLMMEGLSQNREIWYHSGALTNTRSTQWHCQLDVFGGRAQQNSTLLATMAKTDWSCAFFARAAFMIQPLYATTPTNMTIINAETEYELRFSFTLMMQYNPHITVSQDYFDTANVNLVDVDTTFKP